MFRIPGFSAPTVPRSILARKERRGTQCGSFCSILLFELVFRGEGEEEEENPDLYRELAFICFSSPPLTLPIVICRLM